MRHVYTAELARLRWPVINVRTGQLVGAFANCADASIFRDNGPRNSQGERLLELGKQEPKVTKPRLRQRRRVEKRQAPSLADLISGSPEIAELTNYFQRSA